MTFRIRRDAPFLRVFGAYYRLRLMAVWKFMFGEVEVELDTTPDMLGMRDGDTVHAFVADVSCRV